MTKGPNPKAEVMPQATVSLACEDCGEQIAEMSLNTHYLATALFAVRKEHAKARHDWKEGESPTAPEQA